MSNIDRTEISVQTLRDDNICTSEVTVNVNGTLLKGVIAANSERKEVTVVVFEDDFCCKVDEATGEVETELVYPDSFEIKHGNKVLMAW